MCYININLSLSRKLDYKADLYEFYTDLYKFIQIKLEMANSDERLMNNTQNDHTFGIWKDNPLTLLKAYCASAVMMPIIFFLILYLLPIFLPSSALPHTFFQPNAAGFGLKQTQIYLNSVPLSSIYNQTNLSLTNPIPNTAANLAEIGPFHNFQHFNWKSQQFLTIITFVGVGILLLGIAMLQQWAKGQEFGVYNACSACSSCCNANPVDPVDDHKVEDVMNAKYSMRAVKFAILAGLIVLLIAVIFRGIAVIKAPAIEKSAQTQYQAIGGFQEYSMASINLNSKSALSPPYYFSLDPRTTANDTTANAYDSTFNSFLYTLLQGNPSSQIDAVYAANYMNEIYGCHFGSNYVKFSNRWSADSSISCEAAMQSMRDKQTVENMGLATYLIAMIAVVIFEFFLQCQWCRLKENPYEISSQETKCEDCCNYTVLAVQCVFCCLGFSKIPQKKREEREENQRLMQNHESSTYNVLPSNESPPPKQMIREQD